MNIASVAGLYYTYPHVGYAASKAGLIAFTRDVAFEAARFGVRVNCIAPGLIAKERNMKELQFVIGATIPVSGGTTLMVSMTANEAGAAIDKAVTAA